jgi:hypothetical protein
MTSRKKPGVAFWATVVVVVIVLYVASFGPAVWVIGREWSPDWTYEAFLCVYAPIFLLHESGPLPIHDAILWYAHLWAD